MERKTVNIEETRGILRLSKHDVAIYLRLGILTPVTGTENSNNPIYYADEVASLREIINECQKSLKTLTYIRENIKAEVRRANSALATLQIDAATKDGVVNSLIDSISIFVKNAIPQLKDYEPPLSLLEYADKDSVERIIEKMKGVSERNTPQDFLNNLYQKVELMDATSIRNCMVERDNLIKERRDLITEKEELEKKVYELSQKVVMLGNDSEANTYLARNGFKKKLSEKQVEGLMRKITECGFTRRTLNCLNSKLYNWEKDVTIADVVALSQKELGEIMNLGKSSKCEIEDKLAESDLAIGMDILEIDGNYYSR